MIHQAGRTMVDSGGSKVQCTVPNKADFIMIYSTFPGRTLLMFEYRLIL